MTRCCCSTGIGSCAIKNKKYVKSIDGLRYVDGDLKETLFFLASLQG